jgi:hypothetical protein
MPTLRAFLTTAAVVFIALLLDVALLHRQATVGKLPFKVKIFPDVGGSL